MSRSRTKANGAAMTTTKPQDQAITWYTLSADDAAAQLGVEPDRGLSTEKAAQRLAEYGPNELPTEPPPSVWVVGRGQLANPMNIMLLIVCGASFAIAQWATARSEERRVGKEGRTGRPTG